MLLKDAPMKSYSFTQFLKLFKRHTIFLMFVSVTLFLSGCGIEISNSKEISKSKMIKIARQHYCSSLKNYPFDYCIHLLKPHFSKLSDEDKQEVALNFMIFGKLDAGSAVTFMELIERQKCDILGSLRKIPNKQLKQKFNLDNKAISKYHRKIEIYSLSEPVCSK